MGALPWEVVLVDLGRGEDVFTEFVDEARPTAKQIIKCRNQIRRLGQHGFALDGDYFDDVEGSTRKLKEFRLRADKAAFRFLFVQRQSRFVMLKGFKHTRMNDVDRYIAVAEARLTKWEETDDAR
jgi:hypothetical protein